MRQNTGEGQELEPAASSPLEKNGYHSFGPPSPSPRRRATRSRVLTMPLLVALCCGLGAFLVTSFVLPKWYESSVTLLFNSTTGQNAGSLLQQLGGGSGSDGGMSLGNGLYVTPNVGNNTNMAMSVLATGRCQWKVINRLHLVQRWHLTPEETGKRFSSNTAYAVDRNGFLSVSATDTNPRLAQQIVNAYVDALREVSTDLSVYYARRNRVALQGRLHQLKAALAAEQDELVRLQTHASRSQPLGKQSNEAFAALETQRRQTQIDLAANEGEIRKRQQLAGAASADAQNLPTAMPFAQKANENLRDLERQFAAVKAVYNPDYPQYQELEAEVAQARAQVQAEVQREVQAVRSGISPDMAALYATHARLRAQLSGIQAASAPVQAALISQPSTEMRQAQLTSQVAVDQDLVRGMRVEVERAQEAEDRNVPTFETVDGAPLPDKKKPILPRVWVTTVLSALAGFLLALSWRVAGAVRHNPLVVAEFQRVTEKYSLLDQDLKEPVPVPRPLSPAVRRSLEDDPEHSAEAHGLLETPPRPDKD